MIKKNNGFTLVELIVTIVVSSIALLMIAYLVSNIYTSWNNVRKNDDRNQSQRIIVECMDTLKEDINNNNSTCYIDTELSIIYNNSLDLIVYLQFYANPDCYHLVYNNNDYTLQRTKRIDLIKESSNTLLIKVVFDDESEIEKKYTFKNSVEWR